MRQIIRGTRDLLRNQLPQENQELHRVMGLAQMNQGLIQADTVLFRRIKGLRGTKVLFKELGSFLREKDLIDIRLDFTLKKYTRQ